LGGSQYKLIPYDQISVKFTYHPEHDSKIPIPIQPDGNITLDGVGTVQAAGLTPAELGKSIAEKTSNRLRDPEVVVTITQYAPRKVYVGGQVNTPGVVLIQDGMTPLQAIFDRGGFTSTAQIDSVVIIRDAGSEKQKIGRIDLSQPLENATPESMTLSANDVVYVPMTGIGRADLWVKQHLRDIVPSELLGIGSMGAGFR
jgi:polysaccharide export outer membrane protein